jgi:hypothetical protein
VAIFACFANGQQELECVVKHNATSGFNDQRITTCELRNARYDLMTKPMHLKNTNETEALANKNIRVKFVGEIF